MSIDVALDVGALAINVTIPEALRWTDTRRGEEFTLTTLNVRGQSRSATRRPADAKRSAMAYVAALRRSSAQA